MGHEHPDCHLNLLGRCPKQCSVNRRAADRSVDDMVELVSLETEYFGKPAPNFIKGDHGSKGGRPIKALLLACRNDGSPVVLDTAMKQQIDPIVRYEELVQRLSHLYATKFAAI